EVARPVGRNFAARSARNRRSESPMRKGGLQAAALQDNYCQLWGETGRSSRRPRSGWRGEDMKRSGIRNPGTPGRRRRARCEEGISQASPRVTRDDYTELRIAGSEADGGAVAYKPIGFTVYVETQYI